ncbi:DUF3053 domain-containing protein [Sodalis sp. (in: enterobacteria)]|uniref:DUF3053 domain-containing protein n=1 Tax=Sodalis sp. (in: enterobacteria) TaxID=1898979 RepID=UPI003F3C3643
MTLRERMGLYRPLLAMLVLLLGVFQLTGCGDKEPEQRQAFIQFLQNTVLPGGERIPTLSAAQKEQFGPYANDYQILQTFSDKSLSSVNGSLVPVLDEISQIRVPQDYVSHRQTLAQAGGALNMLAPDLARAKKQADDGRAALKQPEDLQKVYKQAYDKLVTGPIQKVTPVICAASSLAEQLVHVGDFLAMQTGQGQPSYEGGSVSFPTQLQVTQYNELMTGLQNQHQQLLQAQNSAGALLP